MRRPVLHAAALALLCVACPVRASSTSGVSVTHFLVTVAPLYAGAVAGVSFAGAGGSTSESTGSSGGVTPDQDCTAASGSAFGDTASATAADPFAGASANLVGDAFGDGATISATAWAGDQVAQSTGSGTIGLVDGVGAARFTLAPGSRLTISADVRAWASSTGGASDLASSGVLMTIADETGLGPQFADVNFSSFASGAFGAVDDLETTVVRLVYDNDTDADISGLFSGYVSAFASSGGDVSPVPEPCAGSMMAAGLLLAAALFGRRGHEKSRREAGFLGGARRAP